MKTLTTLDELGLQLVKELQTKISIVLFKWSIYFWKKDPFAQGHVGRMWIFYGTTPESFIADFSPDSGIVRGSGGYGLYSISLDKKPIKSTNGYRYNNKFIYPVSYSFVIYLNNFPGIKLNYLLNNININNTHTFLYEG